MPAQENVSSSNYRSALCAAMEDLACDERVVFLGQGVSFPGTFMSGTLEGVPEEKRIELPVAEEMQMGMSVGLSLAGFVPVTIYPRFNFLLCAMNQLINHVDVIMPHVIVRVGVGAETPLYPGPQHVGNFSGAFRKMLRNTPVIELKSPDQIEEEYLGALKRNGPTVLVEDANLY